MGKRLSRLRVSQHGGTRGGGGSDAGECIRVGDGKAKEKPDGKIKDANAAQRKQKCAFFKKMGKVELGWVVPCRRINKLWYGSFFV